LAPADSLSYLKEIPSGLGDMGREAAIRKTADHLSIEAGSRPAFLAAARQSVKDMDEARALRSREVSALGVVCPAVGEEFRRSTERYTAAREGALGRLEPYLAQTSACQDFRQEFDSWAGIVAAKGQGAKR
jgi:GAF domain-containing protein